MPLDLLKKLSITKKQDITPKPVIHHPKNCPECGGWIEYKKNNFGKFYVCRHCKWSCTGEHI